MRSNPPNDPGPRKEPTQRPAWLLPTPPRRDAVGRSEAVGDGGLRELTLHLIRGENLQREEAATLLTALLNLTATDAQIAGALTALATKGETVEELAGMAEAMCARAVRLDTAQSKLIDTAGTGSSQVKRFIDGGCPRPTRTSRRHVCFRGLCPHARNPIGAGTIS
jgi:hypothetical protein